MALDVLPTAATALNREQLEARFKLRMSEDLALGRQVSYAGNKRIPFLRLYRYKEAFSLSLVNRLLDEFDAGPNDIVFDPFAGMGTTLFASMLRGLASIGIDRLPIGVFVAKTLPSFFGVEPGILMQTYERLQPTIQGRVLAHVATDVQLIRLAFDEPTLVRLRQWKTAIEELEPPLRDIFLVLFFGALESVSYTSNDGQFPRLKLDKKVKHPDQALREKVADAEADLMRAPMLLQKGATRPEPLVLQGDARDCVSLMDGVRPTILITSPPYANRYDYTRSYCLELCFHFVRDFGELRNLRFSILRSHIEAKTQAADAPVHSALQEVNGLLVARRLNNPRILPMLIAYFVDMKRVIEQWAAILAPRARVAMVVDNVRFDGEIVPVDLILSELAEECGFLVKEIRVARYKGNSSQQMGRFGREVVRESIVFWERL